jgi:transcription elongation factor SPT6
MTNPLFLQILDAERNGDVTATFSLEAIVRDQLIQDLYRVYLSDFTSQDAEAWNELRREIVDRSVDEHLLPFGARWLRDHLAEEVQEAIGRRCGEELMRRVDHAPYCAASMEKGQVPNVVAISQGAGDPRRDAVHVVFLDAEGHLREQFHVDNLKPTNPRNPDGDEHRERLLELLVRRRPQVVVLGGTTPTTYRLSQDIFTIIQSATPKIVEELLKEKDDDGDQVYRTPEAAQRAAGIEAIYVNDEVARIYQHSKRAKAEFNELPTTGKYCVALARFAQSPVTEYAALGRDILALSFDPSQKHVRQPSATSK